MKFLPVLSFLFFFSLICSAQDSLPYDERGKLIYYEVVELKDVAKDSLIWRANDFLNKNQKRFKLKSATGDSLLQADGKMIINKTALVLTRPSGEVKYNFYVESKAGKYRFWLTDFVFIPYQRDRYGNFVAATTIGTPLESKPGKLNAAEWKGYISATGKEARILAVQFKEAMLHKKAVQPVTQPVKTISTKKW
ncbi:DUF4468 domain-containing protein [Pedobacter heparinus]|uniref:DUF4468 domain-containing protein n=1 Tax=Pedobacter heparinus TaxID=984 RepID=UPI002931D362|nr:DUF4468 domain-containing protein [Pedobacter heparinus]